MSDTCYVYLIGELRDHADTLVKVGISNSPHGRLSTIATSCPFPIKCHRWWRYPSRSEAYGVEQRFHRERSEQRMVGEWFRTPWSDAADFLDDYCLEFWARRNHFSQLLDSLKYAGFTEAAAIEAIDSRFVLKSVFEEIEDWHIIKGIERG